MEIAGQVAVQVVADLALLERGFNQGKREAERFDQSASKSIRATDQAVKQFAATATQTAAAIQTATAQADRFGAVANQNSIQIGNVAAQLNDIGVMLAAGQSPFQLAIQQGTQLNQVLGPMGVRGAVAAVGSAFVSLLNPVSLATIAIIAAGGYAVQYFTDVLSDAEKTEEALEKEAKLIQSVAKEWGGAMPALKAYADERQKLADLEEKAKAADIAIADKWAPVRGQIADVNAEFANAIDLLQKFGVDGYQISAVQTEFNELRKAIEDGSATAKDAKDVQSALMGFYIDTGMQAVGDMAARFYTLADAIKLASGEASKFSFEKAIEKSVLPTLGTVGPVFSGGGEFITEADVLNRRAENTKSQFQKEQDRLARSGRRGRLSDAEKMKRDYDDLVRDARRFIEVQELEAQVLSMTEEAANRLRFEQDLLNQAANDNIKLTADQKAELTGLAAEMAASEEATRKATEAYEFQRETLRGVADDFISAFEDGKVTLQEFGDIALNVLDRIADKLLDDVFSGGGSGGFLDAILGGLGSLFGGGGGDPWAGLRFAKGGAFSGGNVIPFARGGVVTRPTIFPMANGAGLMGEAGPEGILPLRRNSAGQLGVMASGPTNSNQAQGLDVDVRVFVDQDGNWQAKVASIADRAAARTTGAAFDQYRRFGVKEDIRSYQSDRRAVG